MLVQSVWNALKWQRFLLDWLTHPGEDGAKNNIVTNKIVVTFNQNAMKFNTLINAASQEYSGGGDDVPQF